MSSCRHDNSNRGQQVLARSSHLCGRFQLTGKIHPWTTFCEGIPDPEAGFYYYDRLYRRNYGNFLPGHKEAEILVLSAGIGYFVSFLNQMGYKNVLGLDSDPEKVGYAKERGFHVLYGNAFDFLEDTNRVFDLVVAEQEVNHLTKQELIVFLTRARKRLKEEGKLILNTTNYANPVIAIDHLAHNFNHFTGYTENSIKQVLEYCGYKEVECYPIDNYVFYWNPLNWIAKMITGFFSLALRITYKMYGKTGNLFTKRIIGMGTVNAKPIEGRF